MAESSTPDLTISRTVAGSVHPMYRDLQGQWANLLHVRAGTGGFLDGTMLVAHPREWKDHTSADPSTPTKKLKARRALACYENFAATIIESMAGALFREQPVRKAGGAGDKIPKELLAFWDDVDGAGSHVDDFMPVAWDLAATFGHVGLLIDRPSDGGAPYVQVYTPLDILDWTTDARGALSEVKLAEVTPREGLGVSYRPSVQYRYLDRNGFRVYKRGGGSPVETGEHGMGVVPFVFLYGKRRPLDPFVGASVLGDPKLYIDLYNLTSEIRELLRNQTFGVLNVPLGTGEGAMTPEDAERLIGNQSGTENVLLSGLQAAYIQPSADNVVVYHAEATRRLRSIYRMASVVWEADSKDAEAEGSLMLKRDEMHQRLAAYADECERAEYAIARLVFLATHGAAGDAMFDRAAVEIKYPDSFELTPFETMIEQAQAATNLGLPSAFMRELRKRLWRQFEGLGDLDDATRKAIDAAIDAAPDDLTPDQKMERRMAVMAQSFQGGGTGAGQ